MTRKGREGEGGGRNKDGGRGRGREGETRMVEVGEEGRKKMMNVLRKSEL